MPGLVTQEGYLRLENLVACVGDPGFDSSDNETYVSTVSGVRYCTNHLQGTVSIATEP